MRSMQIKKKSDVSSLKSFQFIFLAQKKGKYCEVFSCWGQRLIHMMIILNIAIIDLKNKQWNDFLSILFWTASRIDVSRDGSTRSRSELPWSPPQSRSIDRSVADPIGTRWTDRWFFGSLFNPPTSCRSELRGRERVTPGGGAGALHRFTVQVGRGREITATSVKGFHIHQVHCTASLTSLSLMEFMSSWWWIQTLSGVKRSNWEKYL